ncbi:MAG TPA: hypothetical protein DDZ80_20810 [Cyanobacteria bacterium UBA8803]|nr:hypothetical protein [Cyanobacteria bacterium UBA8803]
MRKSGLHYFALLGVIILGTALRFWHLELKPLWLDEVLTAFFSLGSRYQELPLDVVFPLSRLADILTLQPEVSCREIARNLANQSTHPPLFFCLMHGWLNLVGADRLVWALRSLPALLGVAVIVAVYGLNRLVFSKSAALMAAALMAVSPFAVYLSQEARHYTLPMLLITLAVVGLMQIQQDLCSRQQLPKPLIWIFWGIVNSIGCYVHYFFILAFAAQLLTLIGLMYWHRQQLPRGSWVVLVLVVSGVAISYFPWLTVLLADVGRQETDWLPKPENIAPLYQMIAGGLLMVVAFPVEDRPLSIAVPMGLLMIGCGGWVGWQGWRGLRQLWHKSSTQLATFTLVGLTVGVLLQFLAIIYVLGKDISVAPRYNFVYYPTLCALLGASLTLGKGVQQKRGKLLLLFISLLSTVLVVYNLVFLKPFDPHQVAQDMTQDPGVPVMMVMGYNDLQDIALGLSFALAFNPLNPGVEQGSLAFLNRQQGYDRFWQKLSELPISSVSQLNLWVVAPGIKRRDYPLELAIATYHHCPLDPTEHHRLGVPYQLYRCSRN